MNQVNGATTGGSPIHSDFPGTITKTPQANGGVKVQISSHMTGGAKAISGERGVGDISKDMYGSMNGRAVGKQQ